MLEMKGLRKKLTNILSGDSLFLGGEGPYMMTPEISFYI
jgi:hypothetical protein